jgi:hypothetical protein
MLIANAVLISFVSLVFLLGILPFNTNLYFGFLFAVVLSIIGQSIFLQGVEASLVKVGKHTAESLIKIKKVWVILIFGFFLGLFSTLAEPDVQVLAELIVPVGNPAFKFLFIFILGFGVGALTLIAFWRLLKKIDYKIIFISIFAIITILIIFSSEQNVMLAFDSSGTTTGIITVPFLMSLTIGLASMRNTSSENNSFGVIGIATLGTIISYLTFSLFIKNTFTQISIATNSFLGFLISSSVDSAIALLPLFGFFCLMQFLSFKFPKEYFLKIVFGYLLAFIGLSLFVTSVLFGFAPIANYLALSLNSKALMVLFILILGFVLVFTEPAIKILMGQIQQGTNSFINKKYIYSALTIAVCFSLLLNFLKITIGFSYIYIVIPLMILAVALMFFSPKLFTLIAFDSGGIVAGTILTSFVLPFFIGLSNNLTGTGQNALGVIATVTLTPIIALQILGIIFKAKSNKQKGESND